VSLQPFQSLQGGLKEYETPTLSALCSIHSSPQGFQLFGQKTQTSDFHRAYGSTIVPSSSCILGSEARKVRLINHGLCQLSRDEQKVGDVDRLIRVYAAARSFRTCSATPIRADSTDAANSAIFAASKSPGTGNACPAMKSDMVKPMPASAPAPTSCRHE
jgi:hypothetical protein